MVQATTSILQGLHHQKIPMYTMIAGVSLKVLLNYLLIGTPGIDIHGGPIASIVCYSTAMIPNLFFCCKYGRMKFNWLDWLVRPGLAAGIMGTVIFALKSVLPAGRITTILLVVVGVLVFAVAAVLLKAVSKNDLNALLRRKKKA